MLGCAAARVRVLHLDASRGMSAASLLGALIDLGVAPSPILHALGDLELPVDLRFQSCADGTTVHVEAEASVMPVPAGGLRELLEPVPEEARAIASDALGRLLLAESAHVRALRTDPLRAHVHAGAVATVVAACMAVASLEPERVQASRLAIPEQPTPALVELLGDWADHLEFDASGDITTDGAAVLRALCHERDVGRDEPAWSGVVSRGLSCDDARVRALLGEVA